MKKYTKALLLIGMVGVLFYFTHTILGNILWEEYNPITMDISSLTAIGAPYRDLLGIFSTIYGVCVVLFSASLIYIGYIKHHSLVRLGFIFFFIMEFTWK